MFIRDVFLSSEDYVAGNETVWLDAEVDLGVLRTVMSYARATMSRDLQMGFSSMLNHPLPLLDRVLCSSSMMWERHWSADSVCCETVKPTAVHRCCIENWTDPKRIKIPSLAVRTT